MRCLLSRPTVVGALVLFVSSTGCAFDTTGAADLPEPDDPADPVVEPDAAPLFPPEVVDPGGADAGALPPEPTAFRLREVTLRDPHMFVRTFRGCGDITDFGSRSVNAQIAASVGGDEDSDGFLDRGMVLVFRPFDPGAETMAVELVNARCTAPADDTTCTPLADPVATVAHGLGAPACDVPPADHLSDYSPPLEIAAEPCFSTEGIEFVANFGTELPSIDVVVAASYSPDGQQLTGVLRGFLSEEQADAVSLTGLLPGGEGSCANHDARDVGPGGESGWYWYFNFVAERTTYLESAP